MLTRSLGTWLLVAACAGNPVEVSPSTGESGPSADTTANGGMDDDGTSGGSATVGSATAPGTMTDAETTQPTVTDAGTTDATTETTADGSSSDPTSATAESTGATDCGNGVPEGQEVCDDANVDELDGCTSACALGPTDLVFGAVASSSEIGGSSQDLYFEGDTDCPADQVLIGLFGDLTQENWLGTVRGRCATVGLANTDPPSLEFGEGADLAQHGQFNDGGTWELLCPPGELLVGAQGRAGTVFDQLELHCATVTMVLGEDDRYSLELAEGSTVGPEGNDGGGVTGPTACPGDRITTGVHLETNSYFIRVALRCRTLDLSYP